MLVARAGQLPAAPAKGQIPTTPCEIAAGVREFPGHGATVLDSPCRAGKEVRVDLALERARVVTDRVMGGVSQAGLVRRQVRGVDALCLEGDVSTENNGGFVQLSFDLGHVPPALLAGLRGIRVSVLGNDEVYGVHLRTRDLDAPWQSYRADFRAPADHWAVIDLPLADFVPHRTGRPLRPERLSRLGIVAIGRPFRAYVCVSAISLLGGGDLD